MCAMYVPKCVSACLYKSAISDTSPARSRARYRNRKCDQRPSRFDGAEMTVSQARESKWSPRERFLQAIRFERFSRVRIRSIETATELSLPSATEEETSKTAIGGGRGAKGRKKCLVEQRPRPRCWGQDEEQRFRGLLTRRRQCPCFRFEQMFLVLFLRRLSVSRCVTVAGLASRFHQTSLLARLGCLAVYVRVSVFSPPLQAVVHFPSSAHRADITLDAIIETGCNRYSVHARVNPRLMQGTWFPAVGAQTAPENDSKRARTLCDPLSVRISSHAILQ